jgi:hypothetical protein
MIRKAYLKQMTLPSHLVEQGDLGTIIIHYYIVYIYIYNPTFH